MHGGPLVMVFHTSQTVKPFKNFSVKKEKNGANINGRVEEKISAVQWFQIKPVLKMLTVGTISAEMSLDLK